MVDHQPEGLPAAACRLEAEEFAMKQLAQNLQAVSEVVYDFLEYSQMLYS